MPISSNVNSPYIGSRVSIISNSEIRYEGILTAIDAKESTISLSKVRSFGTEGRAAPRQVAARSEIYQYVVFKPDKIKDVVVIENALANDLNRLDPAIVSYGKSPMRNDYPRSLLMDHDHRRRPFQHSQNLGNPRFNGSNSGRWQSHGSSSFNSNSRFSQSSGSFNRRPQYNNRKYPVAFPAGRMKFESDYDFETANKQFKSLMEEMVKDKPTDITTNIFSDNDENVPVNKTETDAAIVDSEFYNKKVSFFDGTCCTTVPKIEVA